MVTRYDRAKAKLKEMPSGEVALLAPFFDSPFKEGSIAHLIAQDLVLARDEFDFTTWARLVEQTVHAARASEWSRSELHWVRTTLSKFICDTVTRIRSFESESVQELLGRLGIRPRSSLEERSFVALANRFLANNVYTMNHRGRPYLFVPTTQLVAIVNSHTKKSEQRATEDQVGRCVARWGFEMGRAKIGGFPYRGVFLPASSRTIKWLNRVRKAQLGLVRLYG